MERFTAAVPSITSVHRHRDRLNIFFTCTKQFFDCSPDQVGRSRGQSEYASVRGLGGTACRRRRPHANTNSQAHKKQQDKSDTSHAALARRRHAQKGVALIPTVSTPRSLFVAAHIRCRANGWKSRLHRQLSQSENQHILPLFASVLICFLHVLEVREQTVLLLFSPKKFVDAARSFSILPLMLACNATQRCTHCCHDGNRDSFTDCLTQHNLVTTSNPNDRLASAPRRLATTHVLDITTFAVHSEVTTSSYRLFLMCQARGCTAKSWRATIISLKFHDY